MTSESLEIREAFALESAEMLAEMEAALLALEAQPDVSHEAFNCLFRAVHTIKGSAGIVAATQTAQFCHTLEHLLVKIREQELPLTRDLVNLFLQCHDQIRLLIASFEADTAELTPQYHHLIRIIESTSTGKLMDEPEPVHDEPETETQQDGGTFESASSQKVVRVDAQKLDQLINLVVELVTASSELESHVKGLGDSASLESASAVSLLVKRIQERAMVFRMIPVGDLFNRFRRMVHDLATASGKKIQLTMSGQEAELDKVMAERLREPLLHLIRNAVDHGMETASERLALGKPAVGTISMNAFQEAGCIVIEVRDDGRGISRDRILSKALSRGIIRQQELADRDPLTLIFEPGFSTVDEATMLSGRGVGMDVVKRTIEELRGKIEVSTIDGQGTVFQLKLPLSLALIDGFMISVGSDSYIVPMEQVDETIDLPSESCWQIEQRGYLNVRGEALPCIDLRSILLPDSPAPASRFAVVVRQDGRRIGLVLDRLIGEVKAVIKPLGRIYKDARIISGATILGDGSIALILDLPELLRASESC